MDDTDGTPTPAPASGSSSGSTSGSGSSGSAPNSRGRHAAKKAPAKKSAPARKAAPAAKRPAKKAPAKQAPAKQAPANKAPANKAPAKQAQPPVEQPPAKQAEAPVEQAPVKQAPAAKTPAAPERPDVVDLSGSEQPLPPEPVTRHRGPAEGSSEQELAHHDGLDDNDNDVELSEDGDQSIGAAAAFAASLGPGEPSRGTRDRVVDVSDGAQAGTPPQVTRHLGPAESSSERELAHHDGQDENDNDMELSEDGDQSIGAAAAFAASLTVSDKPAGPASEQDVEKAWKDNRLAQVLYHDWEAQTYDEKWSISFDERCITYARDRFSSLLGPDVLNREPWPYGRSLEIGAGTGFFSLNLKQAGVLDEVHVSDVSSGMVESAKENARKLGFEVTGVTSGAESLPYEDNTFDVVIGHAVIHHIPDVESAFREILRVLKPGGRFVIAGEPTRVGDWYARRLGRVTWAVTTKVTHLKPFRDRWAKSQEELDESSRAAALESIVDLHTFVPEELEAMATRAGATGVKTQTEELLAAFLGWPVRTFEVAVNPDRLGWRWSMFAYKSWLRLSAADRVLSRVVPKQFFYNVGITGTKGA